MRPSDPAQWLAERGWIVESTPSGGVRLRTSAAARGCKIGCLFGLLLPIGMFAAFMYYILGRFWEAVPQDGFAIAVLTLMSLLFVGTVGLAVLAILLETLRELLVREEWGADVNRLEIRRRLLGFSWGSQFRDGVLMLDAIYGKDVQRPFWQLAVKSDGRKHYLIRQGRVFKSSREEVETAADLIAHTTGWSVTLAELEAAEAVRSAAERHELPAELRAAGFCAGVDERLRLTIRPPTRGQLLCGIVLVVLEIPPAGFAPTTLWLLSPAIVGPAVVLFLVSQPRLRRVVEGPDMVLFAYAAGFFVFVVGIFTPIYVGVHLFLRAIAEHYTVRVSAERLQVTTRGLLLSHVAEIPAHELEELRITEPQNDAPPWEKAEIVARSDRTTIRFGRHLPAEEKNWIKSALEHILTE
jgi:hypothetical protein